MRIYTTPQGLTATLLDTPITLPSAKRCSCGKMHEEIPRDAKFFNSLDFLSGYYWDCTCHNTLFVPVPHKVEK